MMTIEQEFVRISKTLTPFAKSLTKNTANADDLVQDTLIKAWAKLDTYTPGTNMKAWLFTIMRNTFYSQCRHSKRRVEDPDEKMMGDMHHPPEHDSHIQLKELTRALAQLPQKQQQALILVGAHGWSYEEAASECKVATGTIKSRVSRGRCALAHYFQTDHLQ